MRSFNDWSRAPYLVLLILMTLGLAVRIHFARLDIFPSVDGVFYLEQSRALVLHHKLLFSSFPPGWPILASFPLFFMDAGDGLQVFRAAQGVNIALGILWSLLTFVFLQRYLGRWYGVVGASIVVFHPAALLASTGDLSDLSYSCALLAAFLFFPQRNFLIGLTLGYAYLVRPEALLVAAGVIGVFAWRVRRPAWTVFIGTLVCLVPYLLFIRNHTGEWAFTGKLGFLDGSWSRHPGFEFLTLMASNLKALVFLLPEQIGIPVVILALIGLCFRPRIQYLAFMGLLPLPLFDFVMSGRYWLPYWPFILLAAGHGAAFVVNIDKLGSRKVTKYIVVVAVVSGLFLASVDDTKNLSIDPEGYVGMYDAGIWLRSRVSEETKIAAYKPFVSFWAGCKFVKYLPATDIYQLLDDLEAQKVDYLVVNAHVARAFVPQLQPLLSRDVDSELKSRVEPIQLFAFSPSDQTTIVFRLINGSRANGVR